MIATVRDALAPGRRRLPVDGEHVAAGVDVAGVDDLDRRIGEDLVKALIAQGRVAT